MHCVALHAKRYKTRSVGRAEWVCVGRNLREVCEPARMEVEGDKRGIDKMNTL